MRILRRGETGLNIIRNIDVCYYLLAEYQQSLQANDFRAGADYITSKLLKAFDKFKESKIKRRQMM